MADRNSHGDGVPVVTKLVPRLSLLLLLLLFLLTLAVSIAFVDCRIVPFEWG